MATKVYETVNVTLLDGVTIVVSPLKIKYLREFMEKFNDVKTSKNDEEAIEYLSHCVVTCMKQFRPEIKTKEMVEDVCDIHMIYEIIEFAANIKINGEAEESVKEQTEKGSSWSEFDLAALEGELFLLGNWRDYNELEESLSLPEVTITLMSKRDLDYQEKKFLAAIQGVDLDSQAPQDNAWEKLKAKVFSGGATDDPTDIMALQGANANMAGFGIGQGLSYEKWD
jgi:hypothetical protein